MTIHRKSIAGCVFLGTPNNGCFRPCFPLVSLYTLQKGDANPMEVFHQPAKLLDKSDMKITGYGFVKMGASFVRTA